ncbi:DNA-binding transcriptional regulator, HxlR family [Streptomyces sp. 3213]|uniref:winged helix-turn-helix transcriptional regulator n=1 Tax=Streptomyces sp. 3213.3 TaxID=1855348 RepID=UPI00089D2CA2|nr:winged helix-turn-helix transcriptional regulator [Streptomyces sp. 3213.3]SEC48855.1 DNA-binding transcriptional regulator, HxlR family [Streptomyces sp. 3213] [Streptomyces sp. 3213.3]
MRMHNADETCGIAQAAVVLGDWWNVLVLREIARGHVRFDALAAGIGLSRNVLTERLGRLVASGVLHRRLYQRRPVRYEYVLTDAGLALLPLLVAMQDWGDRWMLGDGTLTATTAEDSAEHARVHALPGTRLPDDLQLPGIQGTDLPVVSPDAAATVLFTYPGTGIEWGEPPIPGAEGCTLENRLFRESWPEFRRAGVVVRGASTQLPHEQAEFARVEEIPFPLLSDAHHQLAAALRLPTFRAAGRLRHKRLILIIDAERTVRHTLFPIDDIPHAVKESLRLAADCAR